MRGNNNNLQQLGANEQQQVKTYLREYQRNTTMKNNNNEEKQSSINKSKSKCDQTNEKTTHAKCQTLETKITRRIAFKQEQEKA